MAEDESQQAIEELAKSVAEQLDAGIPKEDIIKGLSDAGLGQLEAEQFVNNVDMLRHEARKQAGTKDIGCGFLLLIVGAAITLGTWAAAEGGGAYWVMWGAMVFGAFYILRGLYRKVANATDAGARLRWVLGGIILIGGIVGGGMAIGNVVNPTELAPPSESFVVAEDNSFWEDEIRSILSVSGVITSTHGQWSIEKVEVEVEAIDEAGNVMRTYTVPVIPSTIPPGGKGVYSKRLQLPYDCVEADTAVVWEWVPP